MRTEEKNLNLNTRLQPSDLEEGFACMGWEGSIY